MKVYVVVSDITDDDLRWLRTRMVLRIMYAALRHWADDYDHRVAWQWRTLKDTIRRGARNA